MTTLTPALRAFGDKTRCPTDADLIGALGPAASAWAQLVAHVNDVYAPTVEQWSFGGTKYGWSLRIRKLDRVIVYLIPQTDRFLVGIVLGGKAVTDAQNAGLPDDVLEAIAAAPRYAEGTGLRLPVSNADQLPAIMTLAAIKMTSGKRTRRPT